MSSPPPLEVIIVGAGVAGCSAAYHLQQQAGIDQLLVLEAGPAAGEGVAPRSSGSATMEVAPCIKMMVQVFASSCDDFIQHHGRDGAVRYLKATREGLVQQQTIAQQVLLDDDVPLKKLGSYYLAYERDYDAMKREFQLLNELGCAEDGIEWCEKDRLAQVDGMSPKFHCGIYFPNESVIDSSRYAKSLLHFVLRNSRGQARFRPNSKVVAITPLPTTTTAAAAGAGGAKVQLESGEILSAKHVVVATGGLHSHPSLNGLLQPCYSYLVHVPTTPTTSFCQESPNFYTWGFTHDWCYTNGHVRVSGEDHFNAYKAPLAKERCRSLSQWTLEHYDCPVIPEEMANFPQQYGLYSETPDSAPLVGSLNDNNSICYLLGCNAWGQTILSYCSSLVPGILGYKELTPQQQDILEVVSIRRFSELPNTTSSGLVECATCSWKSKL